MATCDYRATAASSSLPLADEPAPLELLLGDAKLLVA